jgi:hypothetical protein
MSFYENDRTQGEWKTTLRRCDNRGANRDTTSTISVVIDLR